MVCGAEGRRRGRWTVRRLCRPLIGRGVCARPVVVESCRAGCRGVGMRIVYIGTASGTSLQRARALGRLGHEVVHVDPWKWLASPPWVGRVFHHLGYRGAGLCVDRRILDAVASAAPELIWVNQGEFLGPRVIGKLRGFHVPIVNYANDNPFSTENRQRFRRYRAGIPYYDLIVVVFAHAVEPARRAGARRVMRVYISADEVAHRPRPLTDSLIREYASDVAFIGTWFREQRGAFVAELIRRGVPLSIWGDRWDKAPEWPIIRAHWRGPGIYDEDRYAAAIQCAKICIGLVNKTAGNQHTDRSIQIPALGALLCAERTQEHLALYDEGREAVFWDNAKECADACLELLSDESLRKRIARNGYERAFRNGLFNERVLGSILDAL